LVNNLQLEMRETVMAFYVLLLKEIEDATSVVYSFGPHEEMLGRLWLDKTSGEVKEIEPTPTQNPEAFFPRAAVKLRQYWREGSFPEKGCWAS
jgi:hypothetical protein